MSTSFTEVWSEPESLGVGERPNSADVVEGIEGVQEIRLAPIVVNCKELRVLRQNVNNDNVLRILRSENPTEKDLRLNCNEEELKRVLESSEMNFGEFIQECKTSIRYAKLAAGRISINASRQGAKDETLILDICNRTSEKLGITLTNLPNTESRPTKDGRIIGKDEYKKYKNNNKKNDCLKSFDGKISGKVNGWVFAKITFTNGGHQDNVFEEAHNMGQWFTQYGTPDELYVLLIDTDLMDQFIELKEKYHKNNILVVNHVEFQDYLIRTYSA